MFKYTKIVSLLTFAAMFIFLPAAVAQDDALVEPKPRVEREFRQLEMLITRFMGNAVTASAGVESMNGLFYRFMRDNPGVVRILRTNAAGFAVNDVNAESPRSAPTRDVSAQRWYQYTAQYKLPYYSIDYDDNSGEVTLFYAWPLMTGTDKSRFSGAFAAVIDFSAQLALIDEPMAPFQITYRGRAFFQHEWDDVDYNEELLDVRGSKELAIRTEKPLPTRRDAFVRVKRPLSAEAEAAPAGYGNDGQAGLDDYSDAAASGSAKAKKNAQAGGFATFVNTAILLLLLIIAAMFAYIILKDRFGRKPVSINRDGPTLWDNAADRVIVGTMAEKETRAQPAIAAPPPKSPEIKPPSQKQATLPQKQAAPVPPPQRPVTPPPPTLAADKKNQPKVDKSELDREQQLLSKMLKLIKEEFVIMDKKIQILTDRIDKLEKER